MNYVAVPEVIVSAVCVGYCVRRWYPRESLKKVLDATDGALSEGKYAALALLFVIGVIDSILGHETVVRRNRWRLSIVSLILLLSALSISDLMHGSVLGMTEAPWNSFDKSLALAIAAENRQPVTPDATTEAINAKATLQRVLQSAQRPFWKVVYTGAIVSTVILWNAFFLFMSLLLTRHVLLEMSRVSSWTIQFGLTLILLLEVIVFALACTLVVGLLTNPIVWIVLFLAKAGISVAILAVGMVAALAFEWWLAGPWFRALVIVTVLPALGVFLIAGGDLVDRGRRLVVVNSGRTFVLPFLEGRGTTVVPLVATVLLLAAIAFLLRLLS